ncbi:MAG TPA: hypothetical protein VLX92_13180, partial [Kofleriaceae bacterium]|nr:hypothetical protein [Kofleriaceae bacterium]
RDAARDAVIVASVPPDAPPPADAAIAPAPQGAIVIDSDAWCQVAIDGADYGMRTPGKQLRVPAGHHVVVCAQSTTKRSWRGEIDVPAGRAVTVRVTLLGTLAVTLAIDATIDGTAHRRGEVVPLKAGQHHVVAGAAQKWLDLVVACTVRDAPELDCYPPVP